MRHGEKSRKIIDSSSAKFPHALILDEILREIFQITETSGDRGYIGTLPPYTIIFNSDNVKWSSYKKVILKVFFFNSVQGLEIS